MPSASASPPSTKPVSRSSSAKGERYEGFENEEPTSSGIVGRSSGNVYRDLGFSPEEAENLRARSDLMIELTKIIKARRLTQAATAKLLGVTQPRISDLTRGRIDRSSIDSQICASA
ncbi:helix-turn-helix transcriptional regulator [Candidatus Methylomirabilis sp.]|uniref:helix-turn-helix domain-containing protein n=1 Tax=Candidatus Methylomirabilis sp. TaxID=2032687 RepID=UPI002A5D57ED|nr:helix-turn-helix transcriptional regulator [Candidatus Methylomirabilis sp.]